MLLVNDVRLLGLGLKLQYELRMIYTRYGLAV